MSEGLWIAVALVATLIVIVALILGLVRYRRRRISLSAREQTPTLDRSGGYAASSGITFSRTEPADRIDTTGLPIWEVMERVEDVPGMSAAST